MPTEYSFLETGNLYGILEKLWIKESEKETLTDEEDEILAELDHIREQIGKDAFDNDNVILILESDFEEFAKDDAFELHAKSFDEWPYSHIDWGSASRELAEQFDSIEFRGEDYLYRTLR